MMEASNVVSHIEAESFDTFQKYLTHHYQLYCEEQQIPFSPEGLITFLIDHAVISSASIKKYTVKHEFDTLYPINKHHKTKTVETLARRFNISERSVWSILKSQALPKE